MKPEAHAVILAGGRGTRFWPRSRTRTPKQLLNIVGSETMIQQTARRIAPLFPASRIWVVTQSEQAETVRRQLLHVPRSHILVEPAGRNTAAAIALAAFHLRREQGDALMAVLPADHVIRQESRYRALLRAALRAAERQGSLVVLGIEAKRPETGYGYIERDKPTRHFGRARVFRVKRFTEKPAPKLAKRYVASGRYFWNAGMFFWRVSTFLDELAKRLPATAKSLAGLEQYIGTARYRSALGRAYGGLENISVDYAILEPASRPGSGVDVFVIPASVGWSDIGSWAAAYELEARKPRDTISAGPVVSLDAEGNFFWAPQKLVAAIGVRGIVLVETPDAILICPRERAQDVGQIVKELERQGRDALL
jgi:mannose-1-phosphate guanylyltransferase